MSGGDGGLHVLVPGRLDRRTGGSIYDRRMVEGLRAAGRSVTVRELPGDWPAPDDAAQAAYEAALAAAPDGALVVVDGLVFGAAPDIAARHAERLTLIALVHHPLCDEEGVSPDAAERLFESERAALAEAAAVIATSPFTARRLGAFGLEPAAVWVAAPGVDPAPLASGGRGSGVRLLCAATLIPRKGHADLLRALARLADLDWRLDCVGAADLHPPTAEAVRRLTEELGLSERVAWRGEVDEAGLAAAYDAADLFVLPSRYEGYGMVVTEALARGLPVVTTTGGALADTLPPEAGLAVPPGDVAALADALRRAVGDRALRAELAAGARWARDALSPWPAQAARFAGVLRAIEEARR
ncbi:MAG: glycosyltransferase family 4 protein [Alphaproteobacteria bacterium]|nr:glycosyltransferase family 4 protein [Alphaproteobacteria bacterium]